MENVSCDHHADDVLSLRIKAWSIFSAEDVRLREFPPHENCRCCIEAVTAVAAGTATDAGRDGVDLYVARNGSLPDYYISEADSEAMGWKKWLGNLGEVLPGRMIGGKIYKNRDGRLLEAPGRIWYEADFNYSGGFRNGCRLLYSNDGLIFATYDHYLTFAEIGLENVQ